MCFFGFEFIKGGRGVESQNICVNVTTHWGGGGGGGGEEERKAEGGGVGGRGRERDPSKTTKRCHPG